MRLNLGPGGNPLDGYDNSYGGDGKSVYPLELADASVDELRASHLLEHFPHADALKVVSEWARVLKPGGLMRLAVPDFEKIAEMYTNQQPGHYTGWICGGQTDDKDIHLALFDWMALSNVMRRAGLVGIDKWQGDGRDTASLPISLNLAGYKRPNKWPKVAAIMSRPRLTFGDNADCAMSALGPLGIPLLTRSGVYWGKCMTIAMDAAIEMGAEWILTIDYDTLFTQADVEDLLAFAIANPEVDALVPAQMTRVEGLNIPLLMNPKKEARAAGGITREDFDATYYPIRTGHFGCSLFKVSALAAWPKPWFTTTFKPDGSHQHDDDINFWIDFEQRGLKAFLAPRVVVGHLELLAMWPDKNLKMLYQRTNAYRDNGKPVNAWR